MPDVQELEGVTEGGAAGGAAPGSSLACCVGL